MISTIMFNDFWSRIAEVGRSLSKLSSGQDELQDVPISDLCESLLSHQGQATGQALSRAILDRYSKLSRDEKITFFDTLATTFGCEEAQLDKALTNFQQEPSVLTGRALHFASEPRSIELIRRLKRVPGGITDLITMREDLLGFVKNNDNLRGLDNDFQHLFASWFNRGFLDPGVA